jgi:multicomponent Na+:H+ antiporter subunit A
LAVVGALAALSMAGVPPLLGFATKEAAFDALIADGHWLALTVIAAASAVTVAYAARFWWGAFATKTELTRTPTTATAVVLTMAPGLLAVGSVLLGTAPGWLKTAVADATDQTVKLVVWPGWTLALATSAAVIAAGAGVFLFLQRRGHLTVGRRWLPSAAGFYSATVRGLNRTAEGVTGLLQNGSLPVYLAVTLSAVLAVPAVVWLASAEVTALPPLSNSVAEIILGAIVVAAAFAATRVQRRMAAALLLGLAGYGVAGIYVVFSAPDLALTQLLVETLTVALFALVLVRLPRRFGAEPGSLARWIRIAVAGFAGLFVTGAALLMTSVEPDRSVAEFYVREAAEAGGRNIVNIVLTNFRALDTLGEITVLAVAALGISALVLARRMPVQDPGGAAE